MGYFAEGHRADRWQRRTRRLTVAGRLEGLCGRDESAWQQSINTCTGGVRENGGVGEREKAPYVKAGPTAHSGRVDDARGRVDK